MCSKSMLAEILKVLNIKDIKCITNQYQLKKLRLQIKDRSKAIKAKQTK